MHAAIVLLVLILTYAGMVAGRIAWLQVDRTGIALLAVIALLVSGQMTLDDFGTNVDMPTLALLFAMMIISAQFAESGFIDLGARARGFDPRPFAIALAASTNAGSAATLIGNPQNMLLGAIGRLDFWRFLAVCAVPALFSLVTVFAVVWLQWRSRMIAGEPLDP